MRMLVKFLGGSVSEYASSSRDRRCAPVARRAAARRERRWLKLDTQQHIRDWEDEQHAIHAENLAFERETARAQDLEPLGIELSCIEGPGAHSPDVGLHVGSRPLPRYSPTPALVKCIPWQEPLVPDTKAVNAALAAEAATCDLEAAALTENAARLRMQASCDHQWVRSESHARWTCGICGCSATGEVPG